MTERTFKRPALKHRRRHMVRQLFNGWPWIVWGAAAVGVIVLLPGGMNRIRFHGVAERTYEYVSPLESGRLVRLHVELGDTVSAGQLLGELDNQTLATELLMDQASLLKTRDKIRALRFEMGSLELERAKTRAELKTLEAQWARSRDLLDQKLILEQDVEDPRARIEATREVLEHYPRLIERLEERARLLEDEMSLLNSTELKELQAAQCRLEARASGIVAEVLRQPGDVVETGDPVLRVSNVATSRVIAFMPEEHQMDVAEGERCRVITSTSRDIHHGQVRSVTADIRKLPVFTGFGDQILRGRRIVIELENDTRLAPGERVVVVPDVSIWDQWLGRR